MHERVYTVTVRLATDDHTDEHLQDAAAIGDEIRSWLEGLHSVVLEVHVTEEVIQ